jgi:hypothetical protein
LIPLRGVRPFVVQLLGCIGDAMHNIDTEALRLMLAILTQAQKDCTLLLSLTARDKIDVVVASLTRIADRTATNA